MNIFAVDHDPRQAARWLCDKHVVKMVLESTQMLCTVHHIFVGSPKPRPDYFMKATHVNHPCAMWVRENASNYEWLAIHNLALCNEYTFRYGKRHKCEKEGLAAWLLVNLPPGLTGWSGVTPFAQAMPDELKGEYPVAAYRRYYQAKRHILSWTLREPPWWIPKEWLVQESRKGRIRYNVIPEGEQA